MPHLLQELMASLATNQNEKTTIMASLKFYHDTRKKSKTGTHPIMIVVRNGKSTAQINTNVRVEPKQWDKEAQAIINHPAAKSLNRILLARMQHMDTQLMLIMATRNIDTMGADELKYLLDPLSAEKREEDERLREEEAAKNHTSGDVHRFWESFVISKDKETTKAVYIHTRNMISKFCEFGDLNFSDINYKWLVEFDNFLKMVGSSTNTRSIHMRNIRAVYNEAINQEVISQDTYPFRRFSIKKEDTMKRSLNVQQLRRLRDFPCDDVVKKYVDVFFISFYLCGINMVDLLALPPLPDDGHIMYKRSKTGVNCQLTVPYEARILINKYAGKEHMLCFGEQYKNHKDFVHRLNENLRKVGEVFYTIKRTTHGACHRVKNYTPMFPGLSSYWARHTWATLAAEVDVSDAVIDSALGHRSPYAMADIYIRRNSKKVDDANRRVIDYVNEF